MKRKTVLFITALCVASLLFGGCGNKDQNTPPEWTLNPGTTSEPPTQSQEPEYVDGTEEEDDPWGIPIAPVEVEIEQTPYTVGFVSPEDTLLRDMKEIGFATAEEFKAMFYETLHNKNWGVFTDYVTRASILSYLYTENKAETAEEVIEALAYAYGNPIGDEAITGSSTDNLEFETLSEIEYERYAFIEYVRADSVNTENEETDKFTAFLHAENGRYYFEINSFKSEASTARYALYQPLGFDGIIEKLGAQEDVIIPLFGYIYDDKTMEIHVMARHSKDVAAIEITTDKETVKQDTQAQSPAKSIIFTKIVTDNIVGEIKDISYYTPDGERISYKIIQ